jgi:protein gp37
MAKSIRGMKPFSPKTEELAFFDTPKQHLDKIGAGDGQALDIGKRDPGQTTGIEWTNHTWNPMVGCSVHTAGCTNCYAMKQAAIIKAAHYEGVVKWVGKQPNQSTVWTGKINKAPPHIMNKPRTIKGESMIFVNSMSDYFHGDMPYEWQKEAMDVMKSTPQHVYQILTKRPENIMKFVAQYGYFPANVWVGATMEREDYRWRIGHLQDLRKAGYAKRVFLSIEPLVGPAGQMDLSDIDWVIIGGESGPNSREMKLEWVTDVIDQCLAQHVPIFFKQWGINENNPIFKHGGYHALKAQDPVGKGGSLVNGKAYKEFPTKVYIDADAMTL